MKVLAICSSPRKNGNTEYILNRTLDGAREDGAEVELYRVAGKNMAPCNACNACQITGKCSIQDDMQELYTKMQDADAIIIGTPIFTYGMAAQCKIILDRSILFYHTKKNLSNKVGGIVVVGASLGNISAVKDLYFYFIEHHILPGNFVSAYGFEKGAVKTLKKGLEAAHILGRQMVALVSMKFQYPEEFIMHLISYGTWKK